MSPEEIRNQCEDDADRASSDLTVWRDRGAIIAAQQTRIAQLEEVIAEVWAMHNHRKGSWERDGMTFGQTEWPDKCDDCRVVWPCNTARALGIR